MVKARGKAEVVEAIASDGAALEVLLLQGQHYRSEQALAYLLHVSHLR